MLLPGSRSRLHHARKDSSKPFGQSTLRQSGRSCVKLRRAACLGFTSPALAQAAFRVNPVDQGIVMSSVLAPRLQRMAPYFVIGWLLGVMVVARPSPGGHAPMDSVRTRPTEFYEPPLHPATVALGQGLFAVLGLAVFSRRRLKSPIRLSQD
jgi:hypothetical protein